MKYETLIALRYLKAKRKQAFISMITWISMLGVAVGVTALLVVIAVMAGFGEDLKKKIVGAYSHIVVTEFGSSNITDYGWMMEKVGKVDDVVAVAPFVLKQVMLTTPGKSTGVILRGVDPELEEKVTDLKKNLISGDLRFLTLNTDELDGEKKETGSGGEGDAKIGYNIILGKELAESLDVAFGQEVTVVSPTGKMTPMGMVPRMKKFKVCGVFHSGMYEYDAGLAYISIEAAQDFFRLEKGVTGLEVKVTDIYKTRIIVEKIQKVLGYPYHVRDWIDMNRNLFSALKMEKVAMFIILALIVLVASFNIASTLIMVVMEKGRDIAILKSMGATNGQIMRIFSINGLLIGSLGTLLGFLGGMLIVWNLDPLVAFIEGLFHIRIFPGDVYQLDKLPARIEAMDTALILVGSIVISFVATVYPAWRASRQDPIEAIRYE
jgi:lipoprotein-releasing system permease protein